jgi:hypothetical protein
MQEEMRGIIAVARTRTQTEKKKKSLQVVGS